MNVEILNLQNKLISIAFENDSENKYIQGQINCPINLIKHLKPVLTKIISCEILKGEVFQNKKGIFQIISIEGNNEKTVDSFLSELNDYIEKLKTLIETNDFVEYNFEEKRQDLNCKVIFQNDYFQTKYGLKKLIVLESENNFISGLISEKDFDYFEENQNKEIKIKSTISKLNEKGHYSFKALKIL